MSSSTPAELQARYSALTGRIVALDRDIATETDNDKRSQLMLRREYLAAERDGLAKDMTLAGVVPQPDGTVEHRVSVLERDVRRLWGMLRPGPRQTIAKVIFYGLLVACWSLWMVKEVRDWLILHPAEAILITLAMVMAALLIRWLPEDDHDDQR